MARSSNVLQVVINGVNNASPAFRSVARGAAVMGAAVAAAFGAAAFKAAKFEKGLAEISTLLDGDTAPAIARMRGELLDMSVQFGQTIDRLTKARYDIISAGFTDAADSAAVLTAANKLAVAGVSDVAATADLLTTAINGLGKEAGDAEAIADVLFQTVRKGKTTMDQLAASMGPLFATARTAGVELDELGATMATLTAAGIDTREGVLFVLTIGEVFYAFMDLPKLWLALGLCGASALPRVDAPPGSTRASCTSSATAPPSSSTTAGRRSSTDARRSPASSRSSWRARCWRPT